MLGLWQRSMPLIIRKVAAIFAVLLVSQSYAATAPKPVSVWTFSIYGAEITENYLRPFFDDIFQAVGRSYDVVYGSDVSRLSSECTLNKYDIVFGSYNLEMQDFERVCGYRVVALTDQDIHIYIHSNTSPNNVRSLALVQGVRAGDVQIFGNKELVYYSDHVQAVLAMYRGDVDGVVSSETGVKRLLPSLSKQLKVVFTFKEKGHAVALFSPHYFASDEGQRFRALLLENRPKSVEIFVEGIGLGPWRAP